MTAKVSVSAGGPIRGKRSKLVPQIAGGYGGPETGTDVTRRRVSVGWRTAGSDADRNRGLLNLICRTARPANFDTDPTLDRGRSSE
ncbi:hypothetical protein GWI33_012992 [Rhynchophorus ferrugineus]|nr:hypothetical protein GWI33_012992 [Rhynchophorus ferrugineus]